jgi:hypothetical protein
VEAAATGWTAQWSRAIEASAQLGRPTQAPLKAASDHLHVEVARRVEKRSALDDAEPREMLRRRAILNPKEAAIVKRQTLVPILQRDL